MTEMFHVRKLGLYAGVVAVLLSAMLPAATASAQQAPPVRPPLNLVTSPLPLNVVTKPGRTVTVDIRVKNNGTRPELLKVELLKFGASGETGNPELMEREAKDTYFDWVTFSERTFNAEPNVWKTVKMTIKTPESAAFGYYLAVLFSRANPDKPAGGSSGVEGGVASLVLLNVDAPGAKREAKVAELTASKKVYEFLPADFTVKLRNSGNVHVAPVGSIFIKRGNEQVDILEFNTQRGNILPQTNRVFDVTWAKGFPYYEKRTEGSVTTQKLKWDFTQVQNLRFGKYTATLVAVYDDGQRDVPVEAVVTFWVIPWRIIGGFLLIVGLIGIGVWATVRSAWKNVRRTPPKAPDSLSDDNPPPSASSDEPENTLDEKKEDARHKKPADSILDAPSAPELPSSKETKAPTEKK